MGFQLMNKLQHRFAECRAISSVKEKLYQMRLKLFNFVKNAYVRVHVRGNTSQIMSIYCYQPSMN